MVATGQPHSTTWKNWKLWKGWKIMISKSWIQFRLNERWTFYQIVLFYCKFFAFYLNKHFMRLQGHSVICTFCCKFIWSHFPPVDFVFWWHWRIFFQKIVTFIATLTAVFMHFLHWFDCFNYFYGSITCAGVGKTKFLTRHLRWGTWKVPLNMDNFEVFSHFFPFCISLCMLYDRLKTL